MGGKEGGRKNFLCTFFSNKMYIDGRQSLVTSIMQIAMIFSHFIKNSGQKSIIPYITNSILPQELFNRMVWGNPLLPPPHIFSITTSTHTPILCIEHAMLHYGQRDEHQSKWYWFFFFPFDWLEPPFFLYF